MQEAYIVDVGQNVKRLREEQRYTQTEIARRCGVTPAAISGLEHGVFTPSATLLVNLARVLGVSVEELIEEPVAHDLEARPPRVELDDLAEHGVHANATEIEMLNRLLAAYFELAQTGAEKTTITVPDISPESGVDMTRVHTLLAYAITAGILLPEDVEALEEGVRKKLVAG